MLNQYCHMGHILFKRNKSGQLSDLCIIDCIQKYRRRTDLVRKNLDGNQQELILSYSFPFTPINSQSIARYIKPFLAMAGIHITVFTTHSVRSALTIKANNIGLSIKYIRNILCAIRCQY